MSEELKRNMIHIPEDPETMQAFVTAMQRLDNRRSAFQQESRSYSHSAARSLSTTTQPVTALILGFDDSMLSQRLLINVLLKACILVLFIILVELVSMWLGSLCKDSPKFY